MIGLTEWHQSSHLTIVSITIRLSQFAVYLLLLKLRQTQIQLATDGLRYKTTSKKVLPLE